MRFRWATRGNGRAIIGRDVRRKRILKRKARRIPRGNNYEKGYRFICLFGSFNWLC